MKNDGKQFEDDWRKSFLAKDIYYLRLKDNPISWLNDDNQYKNITFGTDNPFDCLAFIGGHLYCMELKSTKYSSVTFERDKADKKQIKINQINGLLDARKHSGIYAGFVFEFRELGKVFYLDIAKFYVFYKTTTKNSISYEDIIKLGGIEISRELLKIHYRYDVVNLIKDIIDEDNRRMDKIESQN